MIIYIWQILFRTVYNLILWSLWSVLFSIPSLSMSFTLTPPPLAPPPLPPPPPFVCSSSGWRLTSFCVTMVPGHIAAQLLPSPLFFVSGSSPLLLLLGQGSPDVDLVDPNFTPACPFLSCCQISGQISHFIAMQTKDAVLQWRAAYEGPCWRKMKSHRLGSLRENATFAWWFHAYSPTAFETLILQEMIEFSVDWKHCQCYQSSIPHLSGQPS